MRIESQGCRAILVLSALLATSACSKGSTSFDQLAKDVKQEQEEAAAGKKANEPMCGNDLIEGDEECDGSALGGENCQKQGFVGGMLTCDPVTCTFSTELCLKTTGGTAG